MHQSLSVAIARAPNCEMLTSHNGAAENHHRWLSADKNQGPDLGGGNSSILNSCRFAAKRTAELKHLSAGHSRLR